MGKKENSPARTRSANREVKTKAKAPIAKAVASMLPHDEWKTVGKVVERVKKRK